PAPPGRIPPRRPSFAYTLIDVEADHPFPELAQNLAVLNCKGLLDTTDPARARPRYELAFHFPTARAFTSGDVFYYNGVDALSPMQAAIGQRARVVDLHFGKWRMIRDPAAFARSVEQMLAWGLYSYISITGQLGNLHAGG